MATMLALDDAGLSPPPQNAGTRNRNEFIQQTSLVVRGIRAAYLVDAFPFPQSQSQPKLKLESWFCALTKRLPNTGKHFSILHEESSDSFFFVNRILLLDNLRSGSGHVPIWVKTGDASIQVSWIGIRTQPQCGDPTL
jgi:hypothetical protein